MTSVLSSKRLLCRADLKEARRQESLVLAEKFMATGAAVLEKRESARHAALAHAASTAKPRALQSTEKKVGFGTKSTTRCSQWFLQEHRLASTSTEGEMCGHNYHSTRGASPHREARHRQAALKVGTDPTHFPVGGPVPPSVPLRTLVLTRPELTVANSFEAPIYSSFSVDKTFHPRFDEQVRHRRLRAKAKKEMRVDYFEAKQQEREAVATNISKKPELDQLNFELARRIAHEQGTDEADEIKPFDVHSPQSRKILPAPTTPKSPSSSRPQTARQPVQRPSILRLSPRVTKDDPDTLFDIRDHRPQSARSSTAGAIEFGCCRQTAPLQALFYDGGFFITTRPASCKSATENQREVGLVPHPPLCEQRM